MWFLFDYEGNLLIQCLPCSFKTNVKGISQFPSDSFLRKTEKRQSQRADECWSPGYAKVIQWSNTRGKHGTPHLPAHSPRGWKERTGLVSLLLSRLASRLHPWLTLGRGIRLLRANRRVIAEWKERKQDRICTFNTLVFFFFF